MTQKTSPPRRIFVVDANLSDYDSLPGCDSERTVEIVGFPTGREALRWNPDDTPAMWLINLQLPDLSGTTLHDMLRTRGDRSPIGLVSDEYDIEDELTARRTGASFYLAKPVPVEMVECTVAK